MIGWEGGLVVAVAVPATVFLAALTWPDRSPKNEVSKTVCDRTDSQDPGQ